MTKHLSDVRASSELRRRSAMMQAELDLIQRRLSAIEAHRPDLTIPVPSRIRLFLTEHNQLTFRVKELREAIQANDETMRKALSFLTGNGFIVRARHATYALDPVKGPLDWESARALRGWEDP